MYIKLFAKPIEKIKKNVMNLVVMTIKLTLFVITSFASMVCPRPLPKTTSCNRINIAMRLLWLSLLPSIIIKIKINLESTSLSLSLSLSTIMKQQQEVQETRNCNLSNLSSCSSSISSKLQVVPIQYEAGGTILNGDVMLQEQHFPFTQEERIAKTKDTLIKSHWLVYLNQVYAPTNYLKFVLPLSGC